MKTSERQKALAVGAMYFTPTKPCVRGHVAKRYTANGTCVECRAVRRGAQREEQRAKDRARAAGMSPEAKAVRLEQRRAAHAANAKKINARKAAARARTKDALSAAAKAWYASMSAEQKAAHLGKAKLRSREWRARNPQKHSALTRKYQLAKLQRVPSWLDADDFWLMEQAYELAALRTKTLGFQWHVDHVVPLRGKTVSGLHVPQNLRVIPGVENSRKGNRSGAP